MDDDVDSPLITPATTPGRDARARAVSLLAIAAFCLVLLLLMGITQVARIALEPPIGFHGARLGLVASDVRNHFDLPGIWRAEPEELVWLPKEGKESVREVHFEFHMGSLVAVRAVVRADDATANGEPIESTHASVLARSPRGDGDVDVFLAARDCPTHAAELSKLLRGR